MITALVSQKGGSGKSTLAVSIAWELLHRGSRVLLVDTDPQATSREVGEQASALNVAAPSIVAMGKDLFKSNQLPQVASGYDHVVIDTPGRSGDIQAAALMVADVVLIPVGQSAADIWSLTATLEVVEKARALRPDLKAALVVTRKKPRTSLGKALRSTLEESGLPILQSSTTNRVAWEECLGAGCGVAQYQTRDAAADELRSLVSELMLFAETNNEIEVAHG